jgi:prepilin-type N-terminal cleavage/methylation domain-containing protein
VRLPCDTRPALHPPGRRPKNSGFTLLEILVAVSVLGIALVSLLGLHARNIRLAAETQDMTMAAMLASRVVAITKAGSLPREGVEKGRFTSNERESARGDEIYGGEGSEDFLWHREVGPPDIPLPPEAEPRVITVSVTRSGEKVPAAQLTFLMANKAKIIRALAAGAALRERNEQ